MRYPLAVTARDETHTTDIERGKKYRVHASRASSPFTECGFERGVTFYKNFRFFQRDRARLKVRICRRCAKAVTLNTPRRLTQAETWRLVGVDMRLPIERDS